MKNSRMPFTFLLLAATSLTAFGQAKIDFGLKGGWNFASLTGVSSVATATKNKSGYHYGAYAMIKMTKFAIQPEILFSQQGESYSYLGADYGTKLDYVNIPVMVKFYLVEGLNLQVGPQIGFVTKAIGSVKDVSTGAITTDQDVKSFLNSSDFSIAVGAGFDLPFGLNFTARYNIGISDINKYTGTTPPTSTQSWMGTSASKNQVFQFSLGYRLFKIGN